MRRACIDIGSNTTRLLVADCTDQGLSEVHQARAYTRIGQALAPDGTIGAEKVAEVGEVVADQVAVARRLGVEEIRCVATASVRRATNRAELVRWVERRCGGLAVEILSGEEEARLAFLGASRTLELAADALLGVVDVGGGSSELVVGSRADGVSWWTSLPLGSGDLAREFLSSDPPSARELAQARARVDAVLSGIRPPAVTTAVAVGGSATSLLQLGGTVLDADVLSQSLVRLSSRASDQVAADTGLDAERVKLLPAGVLILLAVLRLIGAPLVIGRGGLREGVLLESGNPRGE